VSVAVLGTILPRSVSCAHFRQKETGKRVVHERLTRGSSKSKLSNTAFWLGWRSQFESRNKCSQVDWCVDPDIIVHKFVCHFQKAHSCHDLPKAESLRLLYLNTSITITVYLSLVSICYIDTELVSNIIVNLGDNILTTTTDVIGQQSNRIRRKTQNTGYYAAQGHSRSSTSVSIESSYATSY